MMRILMADDRAEIRSALGLLLKTRLDLELISEARNMEHVLTQVKDTHPNCIILDWNLPGRPTRGRISVLRALIPDLKIIVTNTNLEVRAQALKEGADAFICKTDPPSKLVETLRELCLASDSFLTTPSNSRSLEI